MKKCSGGTVKIYAQKGLQAPADFILPEPASYVFFFARFNLRNFSYLISRTGGGGVCAILQL